MKEDTYWRMILFILFFSVFTAQGCKQEMKLKAEDFFDDQQLSLAQAISHEDINEVVRQARQVSLNKPGRHDMTLLFFALTASINPHPSEQQLNIVTELVRAGADPLQPLPEGKGSPAEHVLEADKAIWIKTLLTGGLSPDARDRVENDPILFRTKYAKNTETLKAMLDAGANINIKDSLGETLLISAFFYGSFEHVKLLLERGADPDPVNAQGMRFAKIVAMNMEKSDKSTKYYQQCKEIKEMLIQRNVSWPAQ